jgi:hypothetical protein
MVGIFFLRKTSWSALVYEELIHKYYITLSFLMRLCVACQDMMEREFYNIQPPSLLALNSCIVQLQPTRSVVAIW